MGDRLGAPRAVSVPFWSIGFERLNVISYLYGWEYFRSVIILEFSAIWYQIAAEIVDISYNGANLRQFVSQMGNNGQSFENK